MSDHDFIREMEAISAETDASLSRMVERSIARRRAHQSGQPLGRFIDDRIEELRDEQRDRLGDDGRTGGDADAAGG